jgi:hypothetical protein
MHQRSRYRVSGVRRKDCNSKSLDHIVPSSPNRRGRLHTSTVSYNPNLGHLGSAHYEGRNPDTPLISKWDPYKRRDMHTADWGTSKGHWTSRRRLHLRRNMKCWCPLSKARTCNQ